MCFKIYLAYAVIAIMLSPKLVAISNLSESYSRLLLNVSCFLTGSFWLIFIPTMNVVSELKQTFAVDIIFGIGSALTIMTLFLPIFIAVAILFYPLVFVYDLFRTRCGGTTS